MKNKNYKNFKRNDKRNNPKLAFAPPVGNTYGASRKINLAKKAVFEPMTTMASKELLSSAHKMNKTFKKHLISTTANSVVTGLITHSVRGVLNKNSKEFSYLEKEKVLYESNSMDKYITNFTTGTPSSESLKELAKLKGTTNKIIFDSLKNLKANRKNLRLSFGFNQKTFSFLGDKFYPTVNDYLKQFGMDKGFKYPLNEDQVAYGCVMKESVKLKILNSDKYLESIFKIHLIDIEDKDLSLSSISEITFSSDIGIKSNEKGKVPNRYQLSNLSTKGSNNLSRNVLCLKNTKLSLSSAFEQNCSVVKTFSKKLPAGSIWEFNLEAFCGSGVRLDQVYYDSQRDGNQPSQYAIAIEAVGVECEGINVLTDGGEDRYIGTSPGWFNLEVKKTLELVNETSVINSYGGFEASKYAIRLFTRDVTDGVDFNVSASDIESESSTFYIPVVTSKEEKRAGER